MLEVETGSPMLPGVQSMLDRSSTWFSENGCVVREGNERLVFIGGTLVSRFEVDEVVLRNVMLVELAENGGHIGKLARAFEVCEQTVRNLRRKFRLGGVEALVPQPKRPPRAKPRLNGRQRRGVERLFEGGKRPSEVVAEVEAKYGVKRSTVYAIWNVWKARKAERNARDEEAQRSAPQQEELKIAPAVGDWEATSTVASVEDGADPLEVVGDVEAVLSEGDARGESSNSAPSDEPVLVADAPLKLGTMHDVQHAGTWLMMAIVMQLGLYGVVTRLATAQRLPVKGLRMALDATIAALSIRERCVEGVRRLATPTAGVLLRAKGAPSATWVRALLGRVADAHVAIQDAMTRQYLALDSATSELAVFYLDNHMRPYTGKHTLRKGWRMQDKCVRPGTSDYYVHDIDGRPVMRMTEPAHGHLTEFLLPIADTLRRALGMGVQVVLAFDRGGAFPEAMAKLRDAGIHFVTYERRPYSMLAATAFEPDHIVRIGKKTYTVYENRLANLGHRRGRVRRISVLTPDGRQINLLAVSDLPAETLLAIMIGRWGQENSFKYGNERWGTNQLDGREVIHYPGDTVIPNPARRRLDNAIRIARQREGDARCKLAALADGDPRREKVDRKLADAIADKKVLLAQRPALPKHVELQHSELAGELVHHTLAYKGLLDTVRIACANGESEFATMLAPLLPRPQEAKKVLANLFAAPGDVRVTDRSIRITLAPAATNGEQEALTAFVEKLDDADLVLPGDPKHRRLHFRIHK
jgi:transposase